MADFDKVIPPGEEGEIKVKIHGRKIRPGHFNKGYTVKTNDPKRSRVILSIVGDIKKVFGFSNDMSISGFVDEDMKLETIITNLIETPINITDFKWSGKAVDYARLKDKLGVKLETIEKGRKYRLKVWNKENLSPGHYMGDIVLMTDFDKLKEKTIAVRFTVTPDVEVHPRTIHLGEMLVPEGMSKSFDRNFRVIAARGDSLKVLSVIPDREDVTVKIQEIEPGKAYRGTIRIRPQSTVGRYSASLKIITNYPGYEELKLRVKGIVRTGVRRKAGR
ncbi:MAG: hypothetical protein KAX38_01485 [Candidatus Krumholzibacteria bacterium]|nr:hypothetical protein [Candidatus Krumholzibacteria bacterium]